MATHSSTLAWKIPRTEEPGGLQSMGSLRVGHDWATSRSLSLSCTGEGNGNPLQCSCLENPKDGRAWWAALYGVAQNQTQLKRLSSIVRRPFKSEKSFAFDISWYIIAYIISWYILIYPHLAVTPSLPHSPFNSHQLPNIPWLKVSHTLLPQALFPGQPSLREQLKP